MAFCSKCGAALKPGTKFCENCGAPVQPAASAQPSQPYQQPAQQPQPYQPPAQQPQNWQPPQTPVPPPAAAAPAGRVCPSCGAELTVRRKFCLKCGANVLAVFDAPAAQWTPPQQPAPRPAQQAPAYQQPQAGRPAQGVQRPAQNTPPQPQAARPAQTAYQQPSPSRSAAGKGPKTGGGTRIVAAVVAFALLIGITGFWKPGFFVKHGGEPGGYDGGYNIPGAVTTPIATTPSGDPQNEEAETWNDAYEPPSIGAPDFSIPRTETARLTTAKMSASAGGVTVVMDKFSLTEDAQLSVTKGTTQGNDDEGWSMDVYDISVGDLHDLDTYVDIRIPYDPDRLAPGEDPGDCLEAMYYNEETDEWEPVHCAVDAAAREVIVYTNHFSKYGVYHVSKSGTPQAKVVRSGQLDEMMTKFMQAENQRIYGIAYGDRLRYWGEVGIDIIDKVISKGSTATGFAENAWDVIRTGMKSADVKFTGLPLKISTCKKIAGTCQAMGYASTAWAYVKLCKDAATNGGVLDQEVMNVYADLTVGHISAAMSAVGSALGLGVVVPVAVIGMWAGNMTLQGFKDAEYNKHLARIENVYNYYTECFSGRTDSGSHKKWDEAAWLKFVKKTYKDNINTPSSIDIIINDKIDEVAEEFFHLTSIDFAEIVVEMLDDDSFTLHDMDGNVLPKGNGAIKKDFDKTYPDVWKTDEKARLKARYVNRLKAEVLQEVIHKVQYDAEMDAYNAMLKSVKQGAATFNAKIRITVKDGTPDHKLAGATLRFTGLAPGVKQKSWTFTMGDGQTVIQPTLIGYITAGCPGKIECVVNGEVVETQSFELDELVEKIYSQTRSTTVAEVTFTKEPPEKPQEPQKPAETTKPQEPASKEPEYAWVQVKTWQTQTDPVRNGSGSDWSSSSATNSGLSHAIDIAWSWNNYGVHAEGTAKVTSSLSKAPDSVIKGGVPQSFTLSANFANTGSGQYHTGNVTFGTSRYKDGRAVSNWAYLEDEQAGTGWANVKESNPSVTLHVKGSLPESASPGDQIVYCYGTYSGDKCETYWLYEWKQVGEAPKEKEPKYAWTLVKTEIDKKEDEPMHDGYMLSYGEYKEEKLYTASATSHGYHTFFGGRNLNNEYYETVTNAAYTCQQPPSTLKGDQTLSLQVSVEGTKTHSIGGDTSLWLEGWIDWGGGRFQTADGKSKISAVEDSPVSKSGTLSGKIGKGSKEGEERILYFCSDAATTKWVYQWKQIN